MPSLFSRLAKSHYAKAFAGCGAVLMFPFWIFAQSRPAHLTMPGESYQGPLPEFSQRQEALRDRLQEDLQDLAGEIGERNVTRRPRQLAQAADFIYESLQEAGYDPGRDRFECRGQKCDNLWCQIGGTEQPREVVIIGAHYDTVPGCPGANDNGTGVVALLALARRAAEWKPDRTLRFVAFANEEAPHFQTREMGSWIHARGCKRRREDVKAMLSLETIGYFSDREGSQQYPSVLQRYYPSRGNFIAFVGNMRSQSLVKEMVGSFRASAKFPSEGGSMPSWLPGIGWSDHWSFWQFGYPGVMVTDTAPFRYPHYHKPTDTPDRVDYARMALVVEGLEAVIKELAEAE